MKKNEAMQRERAGGPHTMGSKIGPVLACFGPSRPVGSLLLGLRLVLGQTSMGPKNGFKIRMGPGPNQSNNKIK